MSQTSKKFTQIAAFLIAFSIVATGCGNAASNEEGGNTSSVNPQTETPSAADDPAATITSEIEASATVAPESDKPAAEKESEAAAAAEKPAETLKPMNKPAVSAKPAEKPAATPKPTNKPAATAKPAATPKPTNKPAATAKPTEKPAAIKVADIVAKIKEDVELPMLFAMEGDYLKDIYGFDPSTLLTDGIFMGGMRNSSAELTVVQLKSDKDYDEVEKVLTKRAESIIKTFESYLQDQHELATNYQIIHKGHYVLLSISDDQKGIAKAFNSFFK